MLSKKDGVTIELVKTNDSYHSYTDLELIITNAVSISAPEINSDYISVKGRNGMLDISEALTGRVTYKSRHISVNFAGLENDRDWDNRVSDLRNLIDGQIIRLIFDNDPNHYWYGRCQIIDFERERNLGRLTLDIPYADPYKYNNQEFTIIVTNINTFLTIQKYGDTRVINLSLGENKVYAITINDEKESTLIFEGDGKFSINFRGGSL